MSTYRERLSRTRRDKVHLTPQDFLDDCAEYFDWCEEHPLLEDKLFQFQGDVVRDSVSKVRPFTKKGLLNHVGLAESRYNSYKEQGREWSDAVELVEQFIYTQKFENAAAGLLNASIISRDLGLAEKSEVTGANGGPIQTEEVSARERVASKLASLAKRGGTVGDTSDPE